jgi:hypothetical protein
LDEIVAYVVCIECSIASIISATRLLAVPPSDVRAFIEARLSSKP